MITAMQDLRKDLQETIETAKDALMEIENEAIRTACQEVVIGSCGKLKNSNYGNKQIY